MTSEEVRQQLAAMTPQNPVMRAMWYGGLLWAVGEEGLLREFRESTGCTYTPPRSAIDAMIDQCTGHQSEFVLRFVRWFNENVWGTEDGRPTDAPCPPGGRE